MCRPNITGVCLSLAFLLAPALAQEGKVIVEQSGSKELKRTAHRLHIPQEQLKNARSVLQEAMELARRLDPVPASSLQQIGDSWVQLNRSQAPGAIESLYALVRISAAKASDLQNYQQCIFAAQGLMTSFAELDPEKALQLIRQWPNPPASLGEEAARLHDQFESQFQTQIAQRLAWRDPKAALQMLPPLNASGAPDYGVRGQVAMQFAQTGQGEDATKIADQVIADFQQRTPDARGVQEFAGFLQSFSRLDPDRFQDAFGLLLPALANQQPGAAGYMTVFQSGSQRLELTPAESSEMNILRNLQGRPQLALKTLDMVPDLKAKLDRIGGLDNFLSPNASIGPAGVSYVSSAGTRIGSSPPPPPSGRDPSTSLYDELRGKSRKNPGMVKARLAEVASDPAQLDTVLNVAQRASYEDPDLSSMALEEAGKHFEQVEPVQRRAGFLQNLVGAYRQIEGEVDQSLLRNGFIIADKLRQEEEKTNPDAANRKNGFGTQADQLEAALVSEYARDNFDAALRFLRAKPDDSIKMMMMMRVVQALRYGY